MAAAAAASTQTMRIRQISHEAQRDHSVGEKVAHWKAVFREKGAPAALLCSGRRAGPAALRCLPSGSMGWWGGLLRLLPVIPHLPGPSA
jgi:hypothetical protein